jgi:hypothetical protein
MNVQLILLLYALCTTRAAMTLSNQTVSPLTAASVNTSYSYSFSGSAITITAGSQFIAQFDSGSFTITQVSSCQMTMNGVSRTNLSCSINASANAVVFSNIVTVDTSLTILNVSFYSNGAVYSGTSNILFYFVDSTGLQNTNTRVNTSVTIVPLSLSNCLATNLNQVVGAYTTFNFSYTPATAIPMGSILQIVLPAWFGNSSNLLNNASANCSSNCSAILLTSSESIIFQVLYNTTGVVSGVIQNVSIYNIKNPPSTAAISIQILIQTATSQNVQQCYVQLAATTPNQLRATFPLANNGISSSNSIKLTFRSSNPIPGSTSYLRISSPLTISYAYSSSNSSSTISPVRVSSSDGSVLISGLSTSNIAALSSYYLGLFSMVNPPSTKIVSLIFTTQTFVNSTFYSIDSSTINIQAVASNITVSTATAQNTIVYAVGNFTVSFITVNALVQGSFAVIQFPP